MNTSKRKGKQRKKSLKNWIIATLLLSIIYVWLQQKDDIDNMWPGTTIQEALPITLLYILW